MPDSAYAELKHSIETGLVNMFDPNAASAKSNRAPISIPHFNSMRLLLRSSAKLLGKKLQNPLFSGIMPE